MTEGKSSSTGRRAAVALLAVVLCCAGCGSTRSTADLLGAQSSSAAPLGAEVPSPTPTTNVSSSTAESGTDALYGTHPEANPAPAAQPTADSETRSGRDTTIRSATPDRRGTAPGSGDPPIRSVAGARGTPLPPSTPADPLPASPGPTGPKAEIVLAAIGTQSGVIGNVLVPIGHGIRAWVADVNARGGLAGHKVKMLYGDDGGEPARALALARQMVDQNKAVAFFMEHGPGTFQAVAPFLEERRIPMIGNCGCEVASAHSPMSFSVGVSGDLGLAWTLVTPILAYTDKRKAALIYCRESPSCRSSRNAIVGFADSVGLDLVYEAQASLGQPDYTAEMLAARNAGAEVIIPFMDGFSLIRMIRAAHRQGWRPQFVNGFSAHEERFLQTDKGEIEGLILGAGALHWDSPKLADFRTAMRKYVPGSVLGTWSAMGWMAGKLLERIAPGLPAQPTKDDFLRALYALNGETLGGLIPPLTFREGEGPDDTNRCSVPLRVENGRFVPKDPDRWACAPGWKPVTKEGSGKGGA
jgi:branched-chain amino acid transport system substrate-binding protein